MVETETFLQASFIAADAQVMLDREISGEMNFRSLIVIPFDGDSMERDPVESLPGFVRCTPHTRHSPRSCKLLLTISTNITNSILTPGEKYQFLPLAIWEVFFQCPHHIDVSFSKLRSFQFIKIVS